MVQLGEECHLCAELEHAALVELLVDEPLHRHLDALPLAPVDHAVGPDADLPAQGDLVEVDDPPAQVGRREEAVFLELQAFAHHRVQRLDVRAPALLGVARAFRPGARSDATEEARLKVLNLQLVHIRACCAQHMSAVSW
jgi:hypothetical protein